MNEQVLKAQSGDKKAMAELITQNTGLIWSIVRRFSNRGYEIEDLFQIGVLGFIKAIKRFDFSLENQLSTYAVSMMIGEIKRFIRDDGMIKVSRRIKETYTKIYEIKEYHYKYYGAELSIEEIANMLNLSKEDVILAYESSSLIESLDEPLKSDQEKENLYDKIPYNNDDYENLINKMTIEKAIALLNELERKVIILRYYREMTQNQIAKLIGTSQVQVSRIEKRALKKMSIVS